MKDDTLYKIHIRECIDKIEKYTDGTTLKMFMKTPLIQDAVLRNLQILSESTQRLSEDFKNSHNQIEWHQISGLRNVLAHEYLGIDLETVWNIIETKIPQLKETVKSN